MTMPDRGEMLTFELEEVYNDTLLNESYQKLTAAQSKGSQSNGSDLDETLAKQAMAELFEGLHERRLNSSDQEWNSFVSIALRHPLRQLVHQDPYTLRAFTKPRGYAGDAELLDYIYGVDEGWPVPAGITPLGRRVFEHTIRAPASEAVRARREFIAHRLDDLANDHRQPHVLAIAAGHLREAILTAAIKRRKFGRFVALDSDTQSLEVVEKSYGRFGVEVLPASVRQILTQKIEFGKFDMVYSTGLFDYVQASMAQRLAEAMFGLLNPGGSLIIANFMPGIPDIGYMESYMAWQLIYRNRHEMLEMSMKIPEADIRDVRIFSDDNQHIIFLQITRR
jgi:hypothetical protein